MATVEGVGYDPGAPGADRPDLGIWWGSNLVGARVAPVRLSDQSKLVYSPHVYGPSVYQQSYFDDWRFPQNMPEVWDAHFGFAQGETNVPSKCMHGHTQMDRSHAHPPRHPQQRVLDPPPPQS